MGFFNMAETRSASRPDGKVYSCASCGLYKFVLAPRMEPFGNFRKEIMNLGEAPGEQEDKKKKQWQGPVGQVLQKTYKELGIDLFEDCININAVNCRPTSKTGNRPPTTAEINACRGRVLSVIDQYKPKLIILLGGAAVQSLVGHRWQKNLGGIMKWRGWTIPDRDMKAWVCPTFHPSFVERSSDNPAVKKVWQLDLVRAFSQLKMPLPLFKDEKEDVTIIKNEAELSTCLGKLLEQELPISIDFETTGLKPHAAGHEIVCIAIGTMDEKAYAFSPPRTRRNKNLLSHLLVSDKVGKIGQNIKYEYAWAWHLLFPIDNWIWDTMLASHVLDNRTNISSLKLQTYLNLGVVDYDSEVDGYLRGGGSGNDFNKVKSCPERDLKLYCGLDAIYTYKLAKIQMAKLSCQDLLPEGGH